MIIGVTGYIASGKSLFCKILKQKYGFHSIDADKIARQLSAPNGKAYPELTTKITDFFDKDGNLQRQQLMRAMLKDDALKQKVEDIIHPHVYQEINQQIATIPNPKVVIELQIIYSRPQFIDHLVLIQSPHNQLTQRAEQRGIYKEDEINSIIQKQPHTKDYLSISDTIIDNDTDINSFTNKIDKFYLDLIS